MYRIGIDVGGTFTDLVAIDAGGATMLAKVPSTPEDPSLGVLEGLALLAGRLGLERAGLLAETERIVHGTTVATNALLERKGARTGLLTTEGHRDVIEMREGLKDDRYNLRMPPPEQLVPRHLRLGVRERMRADGRVETPLDAASLDDAIAALREERVEAVAVSYLHAWRDPRHEAATREALHRALPGAYVSLSSEVLPQIKEFERVSTTIINAYVGPVLSRYLARLEERLGEAGYRGPVLIIQSHGGVAPIAEAGRRAAGPGLLWPGRQRGDRHRRQPRARLSRPRKFPRRRAEARSRSGRARGRPHRRLARHRAARRGARHPPHHQHDDGRGGAARLGAARRRPAPVCAVRFWRRGRTACDRHRPPTRPPAGHRAAHRRRLVGLGHAGDRSALRGQPHSYRRRARARRRRREAPLRGDGSRGAAAPARLLRRAGALRPRGRYALWRAGVRDHRTARRGGLVGRRPATADRRIVSSPPRGALHLCDARPGERPGQCPGRRLRHPRGFAAGARSAAGAARPARRRAADLPRGLGHCAGLSLRRAGPGADHRRPDDHRIGDDDGAAAPQRRGAGY